MAIDRRLLTNIDWVFLATALALASLGVAMVASASKGRRPPTTEATATLGAGVAPGAPSAAATTRASRWVRQAAFVGLGLLVLVVTLSLDYRRLADRAPLLYVVALAALVFLLLFGPRIAGTRRWFSVGPMQVQPSELAKIVAAIVVARALAETRRETLGVRDVAGVGSAVLVLSVLIAVEPDLGTAFCLVPLFFVVSFLAGLRARSLVALVLVLGIAGGALGLAFAKDYQKERVATYVARHLAPDGWLGRSLRRYVPIDEKAADQRGAGYQSHQSRIAVGSGGLFGRGYGMGGQSQLGYLPARHTDFIFSVLAEELGFVGVGVALGLYLLFFWRALETALRARDRLGAFLAAGLTAILAFQVIYNVAMVAGLVPVKGLPLPFLSYGGSSTLFSFCAVGLILNVRMRRFAN